MRCVIIVLVFLIFTPIASGADSTELDLDTVQKVVPTEEAQELWDAYQALDDGDPLKELITKTLLEGGSSNDKEKGE